MDSGGWMVPGNEPRSIPTPGTNMNAADQRHSEQPLIAERTRILQDRYLSDSGPVSGWLTWDEPP